MREELVPDLEDICDGWESNYFDGEDPDEFFQPLVELFGALQDHFAEDQKILDIIEHEESQLSQWIADNCRVWEPDFDRRDFDRVSVSGGPEGDRSIFDVVDE